MGIIENFEAMLRAGKDSAMLRFSLGKAYLDKEDYHAAIQHLRSAVAQDAEYSAAWKLLGKALTGGGEFDEALKVYRQGIQVAEAKGDIQAAKEMRVFLKRLEKRLAAQ
jgi:Tfp pilus assembly protein PilF